MEILIDCGKSGFKRRKTATKGLIFIPGFLDLGLPQGVLFLSINSGGPSLPKLPNAAKFQILLNASLHEVISCDLRSLDASIPSRIKDLRQVILHENRVTHCLTLVIL